MDAMAESLEAAGLRADDRRRGEAGERCSGKGEDAAA
jgi:hypothetical protein